MKLRTRGLRLPSVTIRQPTSVGTAFVTVTFYDEDPAEVFVNLGKGGSESFAIAEAVGRLISVILRLQELGTSRERMEAVVDQLSGIGGVRSSGAVPSVPDAIARALACAMGGDDELEPDC